MVAIRALPNDTQINIDLGRCEKAHILILADLSRNYSMRRCRRQTAV
jgi:hypothetical protein